MQSLTEATTQALNNGRESRTNLAKDLKQNAKDGDVRDDAILDRQSAGIAAILQGAHQNEDNYVNNLFSPSGPDRSSSAAARFASPAVVPASTVPVGNDFSVLSPAARSFSNIAPTATAGLGANSGVAGGAGRGGIGGLDGSASGGGIGGFAQDVGAAGQQQQATSYGGGDVGGDIGGGNSNTISGSVTGGAGGGGAAGAFGGFGGGGDVGINNTNNVRSPAVVAGGGKIGGVSGGYGISSFVTNHLAAATTAGQGAGGAGGGKVFEKTAQIVQPFSMGSSPSKLKVSRLASAKSPGRTPVKSSGGRLASGKKKKRDSLGARQRSGREDKYSTNRQQDDDDDQMMA